MSTAMNELTSSQFWDVKHGRTEQLARGGWVRRLVRRKVDRLLMDFLALPGSGPADVLELGCVPGRVIERLHALRPDHRYHGIDFAEQGIETTRRLLSGRGIAATIHQGDIRTLELPQRFDLVLSFGLLEHFLDPVPIVRDHMRFCQPGGHVAVTVPNFATPVNHALMRWFDPQGIPAHRFEIMQPEALREVLTAAGLDEVTVGVCGGPCVKPKARRGPAINAAYRTLATGWNAFASVIPGNFPWAYQIWGTGRVRHS